MKQISKVPYALSEWTPAFLVSLLEYTATLSRLTAAHGPPAVLYPGSLCLFILSKWEDSMKYINHTNLKQYKSSEGEVSFFKKNSFIEV